MLGRGIQIVIGSQHPNRPYRNHKLISTGPPLVLQNEANQTFSARVLDLGLATADYPKREKAEERMHDMLLFALRNMRKDKGEEGLREWLNFHKIPWREANGEEDEVVYKPTVA